MEYTLVDALLGLSVGGAGILLLWLTRKKGEEEWPLKGWIILGCVILIIATQSLVYNCLMT